MVEGLDHVHVEVSDRAAAAAWYGRVLGLVPDGRLAAWAEHPDGPLILSTTNGMTTLSLFQRPVAPSRRDTTIALRTDRVGFDAFVARLPDLALRHRSGRTLVASDVVDHDLSLSIYFVDPDANPLELTTYEVGRGLREAAA